MRLSELIAELEKCRKDDHDHDVVVRLSDGALLDVKDADFDMKRSPYCSDCDERVVVLITE